MEVASPPPRVDQLKNTAFTMPRDRIAAGLPPAGAVWPLWQRVLFRFFFVYLVLQIAPWNWFRVDSRRAVRASLLLHGGRLGGACEQRHASFTCARRSCRSNGSGDTSYAWAQLWLYLSLAGDRVRRLVDRSIESARTTTRLAFWLRMIVRYYIAVGRAELRHHQAVRRSRCRFPR